MRESTFNSMLLYTLRKAMPSAVVLKHFDSSTAGIPDFSVSYGEKTYWFEVKIPPYKLEPLQRQTLLKLNRLGCPAYLLEKDRGKSAGFMVYDVADLDRKKHFDNAGYLALAIVRGEII